MTRAHRVSKLLLAAAVLAIAANTSSSQDANQLDLSGSLHAAKKQWIAFLGPDHSTLPAGKAAALQLHFQVLDGLHVNSHTPAADSLIPTELQPVPEQGITITGIDYPAGSAYSFAFDPKTRLDVYTGEFTLTVHLAAAATAGEHRLQAVLHYQACDHAACYPPRKLPVELRLTVQ